jgi:hypothetical protein
MSDIHLTGGIIVVLFVALAAIKKIHPVEILSVGAPLIGPIVNRYFARYGSMYSTRPSEQVRGLFERWSIKFSADYYEAKDREEGRNGPR